MNKSILGVIAFLFVSLVNGQPSSIFVDVKEVPRVIAVKLPDMIAAATEPPVIKGKESVSQSPKPTPSRSMSQNAHTMILTAYTKDDEGMDGLGITASGKRVEEGVTIAAPPGIPFGTKLYIPALNHTYTVTDRGGNIQGNRLDVYVGDKEKALIFGAKILDVFIQE